jgi:hypothetical protein
MTPEWQKLVNTTIRECVPLMVMPHEIYKKLMAMQTPEYIAKAEAERKAEEARLAAIEAAKTPAQRLKEKQARCTHQFDKLASRRMAQCIHCDFQLNRTAALWYHAGLDDGRESAECDC